MIKKLLKVFHSRIVWRIISIGIACGLLFGLISRIDKSTTIEVLKSYSLLPVCITFFIMLVANIFDGVCQYVLLDSKRIPFVTFIIRICQAYLFSFYLPGRTGDISILYLCQGESKAKLIKTYLFSKMIWISALLFFGSSLVSKAVTIPLPFLFLISCCFFLIVTLMYYNLQILWTILLKLPLGPLRRRIAKIGIIAPSLKSYVLTVILTLFRLFITAFGYFMLFYAGGITLPYKTLLPISCLVSLMGIIPLTPLGLGVVEFTFVYLLSFYGIDESAAITVPIVIRFLQIIYFSVISLTLNVFPFPKIRIEK